MKADVDCLVGRVGAPQGPGSREPCEQFHKCWPSLGDFKTLIDGAWGPPRARVSWWLCRCCRRGNHGRQRTAACYIERPWLLRYSTFAQLQDPSESLLQSILLNLPQEMYRLCIDACWTQPKGCSRGKVWRSAAKRRVPSYQLERPSLLQSSPFD